jgi:hypothetical protein
MLQVTDLHHFPAGALSFETKGRVVDFARDGYSNTRAIEVFELLLARLKPHLVLFTGDIIDGRPFGAAAAAAKSARLAEAAGSGSSALENELAEGWRGAMEVWVQVALKAGAQWAFVPGNHDDDHAPWPRSALLGILELPGCIQQGGAAIPRFVDLDAWLTALTILVHC